MANLQGFRNLGGFCLVWGP